MNGLTIFRRCRSADEELAKLEGRIQRKRERMASFGGIRMDANGGSRSTGDGDRMAGMAAALDEAEREKRDRLEAKIAEVNAAEQLLEMVPDQESEILERYYLNKNSLREVAKKMHLSEGYVRARKKDADLAAETISEERVAGTLPRWYLQKWG